MPLFLELTYVPNQNNLSKNIVTLIINSYYEQLPE